MNAFLFLLGISAMYVFLIRITNSSWIYKAKADSRQLCRDKFYWVIEDGDIEKLKHVIECFEAENSKEN